VRAELLAEAAGAGPVASEADTLGALILADLAASGAGAETEPYDGNT